MGRFFRSTYNVAGWLPLFLVNPGLCLSPQAPTYRISGGGGLLTAYPFGSIVMISKRYSQGKVILCATCRKKEHAV